jgi:hypothetical protein
MIAYMNIDYWVEQMKATTAIAAQLANPIPLLKVFLPLILLPTN